jgi:transposase
MREALIGARTKIINTVRGWLRSRGRRIERGGKASLRQRVEVAWEGQLPSYVDRQLKLIEVLNTQIAEADAEVKSWATADETCTRLMTVPGVGPLTALRFVAALDDVRRFESAHQVESYLGLVPGESSSSERQQRLSITKAGPRALRWVLVQAAWALHLRCRRPEAIPLQLWAHRIEQRRGRRTAIIALARKLAGILFALWRDGSVYEGSRGAKMI